MKHILRTYVDDILTICFRGLPLMLSEAARREAEKYGLTVEQCKRLLEDGHDAPRKRKKGTVERWYSRGGKTWNIVVTRCENVFFKEEIYLIVHIGCFTRKR